MEIPTPIRATGAHFYRYSGLLEPPRIDWLKAILLNHELYLPSVGHLNDPADGRPLLAPMSVEKMFDFLYYSNRNPTLSHGAQARVIEMLRRNISHHGPEVLRKEMAKLLYEHMEGHRVYSLSKRYNNLSLWAKYADGHSGYCLEFANEGKFFESAVEVVYGETIPMDVTNPDQRRAYFLYCKRDEWSNEEEIRVVVLRGGSSTIKIAPQWLTRLIVGMKITEAHEKSIRGWAKQRKPELTVVKAYFDALHQELRLR
jgi:hypothetical protein